MSHDKEQQPTPRTDAEEQIDSLHWHLEHNYYGPMVVPAEFARQLERELAEANAYGKRLFDRLAPSVEYVEGTPVGYGEDEIDRLERKVGERDVTIHNLTEAVKAMNQSTVSADSATNAAPQVSEQTRESTTADREPAAAASSTPSSDRFALTPTGNPLTEEQIEEWRRELTKLTECGTWFPAGSHVLCDMAKAALRAKSSGPQMMHETPAAKACSLLLQWIAEGEGGMPNADTLADAVTFAKLAVKQAHAEQERIASHVSPSELEHAAYDVYLWLESPEVKRVFEDMGRLANTHPHLAKPVPLKFSAWASRILARFRKAVEDQTKSARPETHK